MTNATPNAAAPDAPTLGERIDAIELFLQQLVVLLEVEPDLSRENIAAWIEITNRSATAHGLQSPRERVAMDDLCKRVLLPAFDVVRPASGRFS